MRPFSLFPMVCYLLAVTACAPEKKSQVDVEEPQEPQEAQDSGIGVDQLKQDLIGEAFFGNFEGFARGTEVRIDDARQIYDLTIKRRLTAPKQGVEKIYAEITFLPIFKKPLFAFRGVLEFTYKEYTQGWVFSSVQPEGKVAGENFEFEDAPAYKYEGKYKKAVIASWGDFTVEEAQSIMRFNLRTLKSGADQYFLEEGKTSVTKDILADNGFIGMLIRVGKEKYPDRITENTRALSTQGSEYGDVKVSFSF